MATPSLPNKWLRCFFTVSRHRRRHHRLRPERKPVSATVQRPAVERAGPRPGPGARRAPQDGAIFQEAAVRDRQAWQAAHPGRRAELAGVDQALTERRRRRPPPARLHPAALLCAHGSYAYRSAEADGNRTRQGRVATLTGFEVAIPSRNSENSARTAAQRSCVSLNAAVTSRSHNSVNSFWVPAWVPACATVLISRPR